LTAAKFNVIDGIALNLPESVAMARTSIRSGIIGIALTWFVMGTSGCGPISSTHAIAEATVAVEAATGVDAKRYAAYEFTLAYEYLRKAREEEGYADYQAAINLANAARKFAEEAKERALSHPERGAVKAQQPRVRTAPASGSRL
jgi:hypothetical protein